jgi:hypothetical protein
MTASQSFIVRVWLEPDASRPAWRASVTDAGSAERRFFSSPEALVAFLRAAPEAMFVPEADDFALKERP